MGRVAHKKFVKIKTGKAKTNGFPPFLETSKSLLHCAALRLPSWIQDRGLSTSDHLSWVKPRMQKESILLKIFLEITSFKNLECKLHITMGYLVMILHMTNPCSVQTRLNVSVSSVTTYVAQISSLSFPLAVLKYIVCHFYLQSAYCLIAYQN